MKRKKYLQLFFDKQLNTEVVKMFGEGAYVTVSNLIYVRSKKSTIVSVILYVNEPKNLLDLYPIGLNMLTEIAWTVVGDQTKLIIQSSFDLIPPPL